jgi:hypothetical protein
LPPGKGNTLIGKNFTLTVLKPSLVDMKNSLDQQQNPVWWIYLSLYDSGKISRIKVNPDCKLTLGNV